MDIVAIATKLFNSNGMVFSFMLLGIIMYFAYKIGKLTHGRIHGSAIAIFFGLVLAYIGGAMTGGHKGIADVPLFAGMGLVGGASLEISPSFPPHSVLTWKKSKKSV